MTVDLSKLPDWPAMMDEAAARLYLGGMSEGSFRLLRIRAGLKAVDPFDLRMTRFARADLDRAVDTMRARGLSLDDGPTAEGNTASPEARAQDAATAALLRVQAAARAPRHSRRRA